MSPHPLPHHTHTHTHSRIESLYSLFITTAGPHAEGLQGVQTLFWENYIRVKIYRQLLRFLSSARCLMMFYISMMFHENTQSGFRFIERTGNYYCQISKRITPKIYKQELWSACHLMILYISMKFHENDLNSFQVTEQMIIKFQREITPKIYRQELRFLRSAYCLMMLYISMKFHDTILNDFQVIEQTLTYHCQISKRNNLKNV